MKDEIIKTAPLGEQAPGRMTAALNDEALKRVPGGEDAGWLEEAVRQNMREENEEPRRRDEKNTPSKGPEWENEGSFMAGVYGSK